MITNPDRYADGYPNVTFRPFLTQLRKWGGWVKVYDLTKRSKYVWRTLILHKDIGNGVKLQMWLEGNGNHAVSFFLNGCMSTKPTSFESVHGMLNAIEIETHKSQRKD